MTERNPNSEPTWKETAELLRSHPSPEAIRLAAMLSEAESEWGTRVVARQSHNNLLFTLPGDPYPFKATSEVWYEAGTFTFNLRVRSTLITADKCFEPSALRVLETFLYQLVANTPATPVPSSIADELVI